MVSVDDVEMTSSSGFTCHSFQVGSYKPSSKKFHKARRRVVAVSNTHHVPRPCIAFSDHVLLCVERDLSCKRKSDDMDVVMNDCDWELKRSCVRTGVASTTNK